MIHTHKMIDDEIIPLSDDERAEFEARDAAGIDPAFVAHQVRAQRNALLMSSDWTQVADAPVNRSAWAVYRQALRDVPQQAGFPNVIEWPVAPA